jgi:hypothetical protein
VNVSVHSVSYLIVIDSGIHTIALIGGIWDIAVVKWRNHDRFMRRVDIESPMI